MPRGPQAPPPLTNAKIKNALLPPPMGWRSGPYIAEQNSSKLSCKYCLA
jgi:hypothetical protein